MFGEMIRLLKQGKITPGGDLRRRFDAALIKKGGILQQPKACWSGDSKINPVAVHMLWAAVVLEDPDGVAMVAGMIEIELSAATRAVDLGEFLREKMSELVSLPSDPEAGRLLRLKVRKAAVVLGLDS